MIRPMTPRERAAMEEGRRQDLAEAMRGVANAENLLDIAKRRGYSDEIGPAKARLKKARLKLAYAEQAMEGFGRADM